MKRTKPGRATQAGAEAPGDILESPLPARAVRSAEWLEGGLALLDVSHRITCVSEELAAWLGVERERLIGESFDKALEGRCPDSGAALAQACSEAAPWAAQVFADGTPSQACWYRLEAARNGGGWFVCLNSTLPPPRQLVEEGGGGEADPEKQQLRLRLLRAESQREKLIQRWPGVLFSQRADFSFQHVNAKIEDLTGVPAEAWRNQPRLFWDVVHEADVEELKRQCQQAAKTPGGVSTTYRIRHAVTGQVSYVLEHRQAAVSKSGMVLGYEGLWLDVTRQTIAEKRLSTAAWKETMALLTIGLAHDFSNLMSGILALTELLLAQAAEQDASKPTLEMIKRSSLQASELVKRMVNLYRSKTGERQYLDFNQAVTELAELVGKVLPRRLRIETELAASQLPVYMDPVEFRQVVLNLALNAADAMPDRGTLAFRVTAHNRVPDLKQHQGKSPRLPCLCLSVTDSGTGIPARHMPFLFDPFFTTKPLTKGSGLGLYNARMFVEGHGGAISVESTEGKGTTFHLWLPQADFTEAERMATEDAGRRRNLLLVAQPGLAAATVTEFLRIHNYCVVATHTPARAVELLSADDESLQGVIVLADPGDAAMLNLVVELSDRRLTPRLVLQLIGGNLDQVEQRILDKASLVLPGSAEESETLKKLDGLFTTKTLA